MTVAEANMLAAALELDVNDIGICLACLSFVSMEIDMGNPHKVTGQIRAMTPILWDEGLEQPARQALRRARELGVPNAVEGVREAEALGPRSRIARAIVRKLGEQLSAEAKGDLLKMGFQPWPPRELA